MKKLFVYVDFDWLDTPQLIGELSCDSVRGSETYGRNFINCEGSLRVPPIANVKELMNAAHEIELSERKRLSLSKTYFLFQTCFSITTFPIFHGKEGIQE